MTIRGEPIKSILWDMSWASSWKSSHVATPPVRHEVGNALNEVVKIVEQRVGRSVLTRIGWPHVE